MALLHFERGDTNAPSGHAFLYFVPRGADHVLATYIVVPPVPIDLAKYVPPLIASSLAASGLLAQTTFFPVPPAPEELDLAALRKLAELRGDDILVGGESRAVDLTSLITRVAEIGSAYAQAYQDAVSRETTKEPETAAPAQVDALLYSLLSEGERLQELARRIGTLRYAVEGGNTALANETRAEMQAISAYLPDVYRAPELIEAAARMGPVGARLAQLYIERAYHVAGDAQDEIATMDAEIASLLRQARGQ
jgi:hypothetical protein